VNFDAVENVDVPSIDSDGFHRYRDKNQAISRFHHLRGTVTNYFHCSGGTRRQDGIRKRGGSAAAFSQRHNLLNQFDQYVPSRGCGIAEMFIVLLSRARYFRSNKRSMFAARLSSSCLKNDSPIRVHYFYRR